MLCLEGEQAAAATNPIKEERIDEKTQAIEYSAQYMYGSHMDACRRMGRYK